MVRILIFMCFICFSMISNAQLVDLIGNLSIQGAISAESAKSAGQGLSMVKKLQILQDIRQISIEIQTTYFGNYQHISKNKVSGNYLTSLNWDLKGENNRFYIQLNQINKDLCTYLLQNKIQESYIQVNDKTEKNCSDINTMKYYFE